jgi:hypothetical protein
MTRQVLHKTDGGSIVAIDESPAERAERLERAAEESSRRFVLTDSQRRALANGGR